jgi:N-glycosylase/DNA lyase
VERNIFECRWQNGTPEWRCQKKTVHPQKLIEKYFCLGPSYESSLNELPWRSDPILGMCMEQLDGLRILRQPLDQTLFFFILSSAKSIPQIQAIGEAVYQRYGDELMEGIYSFPGWAKLAEIPEGDLRLLKMGYRAKYISQSAKFINEQPGWLESIPQMKYTDAKNELLKLPGVGAKIADCTLLFGGNFLEAFPIDTWIEKSMEKRYCLEGWSTSQKTHFARIHFGKFAGLAQQFLFSAERLGILDQH